MRRDLELQIRIYKFYYSSLVRRGSLHWKSRSTLDFSFYVIQSRYFGSRNGTGFSLGFQSFQLDIQRVVTTQGLKKNPELTCR